MTASASASLARAWSLGLRLRFAGDDDGLLLLGDLRHLGLLDGGHLGHALQFDLLDAHVALGLDLAAAHGLLALDLGFLHLPLGGDAALLGLPVALGLIGSDARVLLGAARLHLLFLLQLEEGFLLLDGELALQRVAVLLAHRHLGILLDFVALAPAPLGFLRQFGQAFRIEGVVRVEELLGGLVEVGQRHAFQFQPVLGQVLRHRVLHALHELLARVLQVLHGHLCRRGTQRVDELVVDQRTQALGASVRWPSVCAAVDTPSTVGLTRTKNATTTSTRMRSLVIRLSRVARLTSS